jgi:hypothetical protein
MNLAAYRTALAAWVEAQAGISVQWRDAAGGWQGKTRARLHLLNSTGVGTDEVRYEQDTDLAPGVDFVPTFCGVRQITLQILVTSRDQNMPAAYYLEKLRTSTGKQSVRALLSAAGLAVSSVEGVVDLTSVVDDRVESQASLDVHLNAVDNETDSTEATSYVEKVGVAAVAPGDPRWTEETFGGS